MTNDLEERDAVTAVADLIAATTDLQLHLAALADGYPNVLAFGAIVSGEVCGILAITPSTLGDTYSPVGPNRMQTWARIFGHLPAELRVAFEAELATIPRS